MSYSTLALVKHGSVPFQKQHYSIKFLSWNFIKQSWYIKSINILITVCLFLNVINNSFQSILKKWEEYKYPWVLKASRTFDLKAFFEGLSFFPFLGFNTMCWVSQCADTSVKWVHTYLRELTQFLAFLLQNRNWIFFSCTHIINSVSGYLTQYVAVSSHTYDLSYYAVWALGRGGRKNLCCYLTRIVRKKKKSINYYLKRKYFWNESKLIDLKWLIYLLS